MNIESVGLNLHQAGKSSAPCVLMSAGAEQHKRDPLKLEGKVPQVPHPDKGHDPEQARERAPSGECVEFPAFVEAHRGDATT